MLGDINNSKGVEYLEKLKKHFKQKFDNLRMKNIQVTKESCTHILNQAFNQNIKPKIMQELYKSYADLKFDLEQLRGEFLSS